MSRPVKALLGRVINRLKDLTSDHFPRSTPVTTSKTYEVVYPHEVSEENAVPDHIYAPPYACGIFEEAPETPTLKNADEIKLMTASCQLARKVLNAAGKKIKVGLTTDELDKYVHNLIIKHRAYPSPLRYNYFPKSICTSVNNVVCHGIPDSRPLANGDIISVDVTVYLQGYHGDCAATFLVGDVDAEGRYLVGKSEEIVLQTIAACRPGRSMDLIGKMVTALAKKAGLKVIPSVFGHGIGRHFHEMPSVNHFIELESTPMGTVYMGTPKVDEDPDSCDEIMISGMTFTIEPVFGTGTQEVELYEDGWTLATTDDSRTAQFEHTILITDTGAKILTT